jgi:hypothetical protein
VCEHRLQLVGGKRVDCPAAHDDAALEPREAKRCRPRVLQNDGPRKPVSRRTDEVNQHSLAGPGSRDPNCSDNEAAEQQRQDNQTGGEAEKLAWPHPGGIVQRRLAGREVRDVSSRPSSTA